ncbi:MAG: type II toxin-antitoxin system death-on-curing family toxin [Acidobacteria bacterium]|nr:type II toxin-antitoxin system death-on-curing family toxin [Acidobacteriota bacterium]
MIEWILEETVLATHSVLLAEYGGGGGIRDKGLLESALAEPKHKLSYEPNISMFDLGASYGLGLVKNHPFVDGNKRIAFTIAVLFLEINGFSFHASEAESALVFEALAAGSMSEEALALWLRENASPA